MPRARPGDQVVPALMKTTTPLPRIDRRHLQALDEECARVRLTGHKGTVGEMDQDWGSRDCLKYPSTLKRKAEVADAR